MTEERQLRLIALALFVQPGIGIGSRGMRVVAAFLALEVDGGIAATVFRRRGRAVFFDETFMRSPGLNQRTVHREMFVRESLFPLRQGSHPLEKQAADVLVQQTVAVGTEGRVIPYLVIPRQANEPAV